MKSVLQYFSMKSSTYIFLKKKTGSLSNQIHAPARQTTFMVGCFRVSTSRFQVRRFEGCLQGEYIAIPRKIWQSFHIAWKSDSTLSGKLLKIARCGEAWLHTSVGKTFAHIYIFLSANNIVVLAKTTQYSHLGYTDISLLGQMQELFLLFK